MDIALETWRINRECFTHLVEYKYYCHINNLIFFWVNIGLAMLIFISSYSYLAQQTGASLWGPAHVRYWHSGSQKERDWHKKEGVPEWIEGTSEYKTGIGQKLDRYLEAKVTNIYYNTLAPYFIVSWWTQNSRKMDLDK